MKSAMEHPEDFSLYLDGETADPGYEEIRLHLETCARCREEVRNWRSLDSMFRSDESAIEVPPWQWQRIAAHLEAPLPAGRLAGIGRIFRPWSFAWNLTLTSLLLAGMLIGGMEYRNTLEERQLLLAVTNYAANEGQRIAAEGNPFRDRNVTTDNPFSQARSANHNEPEAVRR